MFLTPEELTELTDYKRPCDVIRWLKANKFDPSLIGANGWPKILRDVVRTRMGVEIARPAPSTEPEPTIVICRPRKATRSQGAST